MFEVTRTQLVELGLSLPELTRFSKCFEWETFLDVAYNYYSPQLYFQDFVYFDCIHGPITEQAQFDLYCFLCKLHEKGIYWHLTIPTLDWRLKEFYVHSFYVEGVFIPNSKGEEFKHLKVQNYLC